MHIKGQTHAHLHFSAILFYSQPAVWRVTLPHALNMQHIYSTIAAFSKLLILFSLRSFLLTLQSLQSSGFKCWELRGGYDGPVEVHRWLATLGLSQLCGRMQSHHVALVPSVLVYKKPDYWPCPLAMAWQWSSLTFKCSHLWCCVPAGLIHPSGWHPTAGSASFSVLQIACC